MKRTAKKIFLLFIAVIFTASMPIETGAVDNIFYSSNDIFFYDESAPVCTAGQLALSGKDNRQKIYNFLTAKGLNSQQAAGVLGNIQRESGYSPTRHEQSHSDFNAGGYGIAQWTFGRRTALKSFLDRTIPELVGTYYNNAYGGAVNEADGYVPKNSGTGDLMPLADNDAFLSAELDFLFEETSSRRISAKTESVSSAKQGQNEWEALKNATSIEDATKIWLYNFEIPANIAQAAIDRTKSAEEILAQLSAESGDAATTATGGCVDATSGDVTALQATVKTYAWPEYHKPGYVTLKPEYKEAVDKALASGGYVGGIRYRGVDCGGFVTRVMIDSGFEPNYNSAKGATPGQKAWLDANWEKIGTGGSIDTATLQPGDVAMKPGHTFMFAGTNIDGFGSTTAGYKGVASASLDERSPMAGLENLTDNSVSWYRKKIVSHE